MLHDTPVFSGFSVDNLDVAEQFYGGTLGLEVRRDDMGLTLVTGNKHEIFVYPKDDHQPATFTILNFRVNDVKATVDALKEKGIKFEHYPDMTDDEGVAWGSKYNMGPDIAWFKDPAGNFLSIIGAEPAPAT